MRILFDNVVFSSTSGPNSFALKLAKALSKKGHVIVENYEQPDVQLAFIQETAKFAPVVQRLDGIWFNTQSDWKALNAPIVTTFDSAKSVIVQSFFDKMLVEKFFGTRSDVHVIHNGTDKEFIDDVSAFSAPSLKNVEKVWSCAATWRPHKRLPENVRYFLEHAGSNDVLIIAGENPTHVVADNRIFYTGKLDYQSLVSLYKTSDYFLHLAWLDHCPNVVVDARAAGCKIICSSSGGTHEVAGLDAIVIEEDDWDFKPCDLYDPPPMDFSRKVKNKCDSNIDIRHVADEYERVLMSVK